MVQGQLIVSEHPQGIDILGIADLDPALKPLVGTGQVKQATVLSDSEAACQLEPVVTKHIRGGEQVIDGYVKFAQPIRITGTAAGKGALAELIAASDKRRSQKRAKQLLFTVESPLHEYLGLIAAGELEKAAIHPFNETLFSAIDAEKWDAGELGFPTAAKGFPINAKIKFANKEAEQLFANVINAAAQKKVAARDEAVYALVKAGAVSSPIADMVRSVKADPGRVLTKIAAHYASAIKHGDMKKAAVIEAVVHRLGMEKSAGIWGTLARTVLPRIASWGGRALGLLGRGAGALGLTGTAGALSRAGRAGRAMKAMKGLTGAQTWRLARQMATPALATGAGLAGLGGLAAYGMMQPGQQQPPAPYGDQYGPYGAQYGPYGDPWSGAFYGAPPPPQASGGMGPIGGYSAPQY